MKKPPLYIAYIILVLAVFIPRITDLDTFISPDEPQWEKNVQGFKEALREGNFKGFYQQAHPGITTQWLAVNSIESPTWGGKRLPLAFFLGCAVLYVTYLLRRLWGDYAALIGGFLLALNPLLIAHSRILSMDALMSIFMIAAFLHHYAWLENKNRKDVAGAGIFTTLAILSKLSAVSLILYFIIANIAGLVTKKISWKDLGKGALAYTVALLVAASIAFPTLLTDFSYVWKGSTSFFGSEHFTQLVHALGPWWYPEAFLLWTTPFQMIGLILVPLSLWKNTKYRLPIILCCIFFLIFFLEIQYSIKKGDRYMMPVFLTFDILATLSFLGGYKNLRQRYVRYALIGILGLGLLFQAEEAIRLHPYLLAYRNPFFASVADGRTMGWGEGLDLAAEYLNNKPNAENMLVAAYYEGSFAYHFKGKFTSAERLAKESSEEIGADYVVLYRTMEGRAPERWETKVLQQYAGKTPEHVISLNKEEYVWIYKAK